MNEETLQKQKQLQEEQLVQQEQQIQSVPLQQQASPVETTAQQVPQMVQQEVYDEQQTTQLQQHAKHISVLNPPPDLSNPVPTEAPKRSWKERRQHNKVMKKASAETGESAQSLLLLKDDKIREMNRGRYDVAACRAYCTDFHLDKNGRPKTPEDQKIFERDQQRMRDYVSEDKATHYKVLGEIVKEYLSLKPDPRCFDDPEEALKNYAALHRIGSRAVSFDDIKRKDPAYFESLDQKTKDAIVRQEQLFGDGQFVQLMGDLASMNRMSSLNGKLGIEENKEARTYFNRAQHMFREACVAPELDAALNAKYANAVRQAGEDSKSADGGLAAPLREHEQQSYRDLMAFKDREQVHYEKHKAEADQIIGKYVETLKKQSDFAFQSSSADQVYNELDKKAGGAPDPVTQIKLELLSRKSREARQQYSDSSKQLGELFESFKKVIWER